MISIRSADTTRPDSSDCETRLMALREHLDGISAWAVSCGNVSKEFAADQAFENLLSLALMESGDAYDAARWLDDTARWEVDTALVLLLDRVFHDLPHAASLRERDWVMQSGVRFPAQEGDQIIANIGGERFLGKVAQVERPVARALVDFGNVDEGRPSRLWVNAEDVAEVLS